MTTSRGNKMMEQNQSSRQSHVCPGCFLSVKAELNAVLNCGCVGTLLNVPVHKRRVAKVSLNNLMWPLVAMASIADFHPQKQQVYYGSVTQNKNRMANSLWLGKKCGCPVTALNLCRILPPTASSCGDQMAAIHRSWVCNTLNPLTTASDCKLADYEEPMSKRSWSDFDLCSQTDEWRFANNRRQIYGAINLKCNLSAMCFCNRGLDSAGCQLLVFW